MATRKAIRILRILTPHKGIPPVFLRGNLMGYTLIEWVEKSERDRRLQQNKDE